MVEAGSGLWVRGGESVRFLGIPYPTRMTVARLATGQLWVCSPIAPTDALLDELRALGTVGHIISPNKLHHLFLAEWARAFPEARLHAAPGLRRKRPDLRFHADLGDTPDPAWVAEIDQVVFRGSFAMEELVFFHRPSRSVIVTDLVQKFDPQTLKRWQRILLRLDGLLGPRGSTPREWRLTFWNRTAARSALRKALAWNAEHLIIAHGSCVQQGASAELERALSWLGPGCHHPER